MIVSEIAWSLAIHVVLSIGQGVRGEETRLSLVLRTWLLNYMYQSSELESSVTCPQRLSMKLHFFIIVETTVESNLKCSHLEC